MNKENTEKKLKELLEEIRPFLNLDGGDIEYIKYEDGYLYVKMSGACAGCSFLDVTLKDNIEAYLKETVEEENAISLKISCSANFSISFNNLSS